MQKIKEILQKIDKKFIIAIVAVIVLIVGFFTVKNVFFNNDGSIVDITGLLDEEAAKKSAEQQKIQSMILRNSSWSDDMQKIAYEEKGNLIDYSDNYLTCDYETLFDLNVLPTYLFNKDKLVAILYEVDMSEEDLQEVSTIHQDLSVNIHYVYEQLYREKNSWKTGQARKYDKNLWSNGILSGELSLQSIWNSNNEKVFLITNNQPLFKFLSTEKGEEPKASMSFIVVSDEYLATNKFDNLMKIVPNETANADFEYDENYVPEEETVTEEGTAEDLESVEEATTTESAEAESITETESTEVTE